MLESGRDGAASGAQIDNDRMGLVLEQLIRSSHQHLGLWTRDEDPRPYAQAHAGEVGIPCEVLERDALGALGDKIEVCRRAVVIQLAVEQGHAQDFATRYVLRRTHQHLGVDTRARDACLEELCRGLAQK